MICHKKLWHKKMWLVGWVRRHIRRSLFRVLEALAQTDDAKSIQATSLGNVMRRRQIMGGADLATAAQPYADLGSACGHSGPPGPDDVIIISARFRSGSTLLWNLFRNISGYTSYYEPFNERRWFDPAARGEHTDPTHRQVDDYWREYEGLDVLGNHYQESWIERNLFMDGDDWDPDMKRYVELLIEHAPGRPVLQFNRIDFRLPWFRKYFPRAKIVHLYRHPRDQWCSSLVNPAECPRTVSVKDFADHYYLRNWARDLKYHFPFLDERATEHPYQMFYFIWKLSYLFGRRYSHYSLSFEDLTNSPEATLTDMFAALDVSGTDPRILRSLIEKPRSGRWRDYADETWFRAHEVKCEEVMLEFFHEEPTLVASTSLPGSSRLSA